MERSPDGLGFMLKKICDLESRKAVTSSSEIVAPRSRCRRKSDAQSVCPRSLRFVPVAWCARASVPCCTAQLTLIRDRL